MNAIVPLDRSLVPTNMSDAMRLAEMMATAKLVPKDLQKSPADCLMVIQQAVRWEMDPFAVAQECSVIQGKLMHSGKLVAAVVNARGGLVDRLSYEYEGEGQNRAIKVSGRLQGEMQARHVTVRLADAKTNNRVWQSQPDQQLMYHGVRVWARRHTPELMLGVYSPEEFDEKTKGPPVAAPNVMLPPHDPNTGEISQSAVADEEAPPSLAPIAADVAPSANSSAGGAALSIEDQARARAKQGDIEFRTFWRNLSDPEQARVHEIGDELRTILDAVPKQE